MAPEKTEALLVTDRRSFQYSKIVLGEHEILWKKSIKYLGVQLDRRLSLGEHLQIATAKAIQCGAALTRLMPNIGGPSEAKRRLVASVVNSKLLYASPIWTSALNNHAILKKLFSAQRNVVMRIVSAYRTVSTSAVLVLASVPLIDLLAEERKETFQLRKELTCLTNTQEIARAKEAIHKDGRRRLVEKWQTRWHGDQSGRWTHRLIPELATWLDRKHGQFSFYLAQALSCHGCFNAYLKRFKKRDDESCRYCGSLVENAEHNFFCARWGAEREAVSRTVGTQLTPGTMVSLMLQSEQILMLIESFVTLVMKTRELDGRAIFPPHKKINVMITSMAECFVIWQEVINNPTFNGKIIPDHNFIQNFIKVFKVW